MAFIGSASLQACNQLLVVSATVLIWTELVHMSGHQPDVGQLSMALDKLTVMTIWLQSSINLDQASSHGNHGRGKVSKINFANVFLKSGTTSYKPPSYWHVMW